MVGLKVAQVPSTVLILIKYRYYRYIFVDRYSHLCFPRKQSDISKATLVVKRTLKYCKVLFPDIEPIYMSDKNSNHVKEIDDI